MRPQATKQTLVEIITAQGQTLQPLTEPDETDFSSPNTATSRSTRKCRVSTLTRALRRTVIPRYGIMVAELRLDRRQAAASAG